MSSDTSLTFYDPKDFVRSLPSQSCLEGGRWLVVGNDRERDDWRGKLSAVGVNLDAWVNDDDIESLSRTAPTFDNVLLTHASDLDLLSRQLHSLLDMICGQVLAPTTDDCAGRRPMYVLSIPKSGTHMLTGFLERCLIGKNASRFPRSGQWSVLDPAYSYHAPCREFMTQEWTACPLGRHPFFRAPAVFVYRNPLDVVASELTWYLEAHNAFSQVFRGISSSEERLDRLIDDPFVLGSIRDRMARYIGWLDFANVIPICYEELVGASGGGDDAEQRRTIWSLQLKLQIAGPTSELAKRVYDPASPTFRKGRIGRHREAFAERHYEQWKLLPQDFMEAMGYAVNGPLISRHVERFRRRPLALARAAEAEIWEPMLIEQDADGYNILWANGQFMIVAQELGSVDLSSADQRNQPGVHAGLSSVAEANALIHHLRMAGQSPSSTNGCQLPAARRPKLIEERFHGFNIVRFQQSYFALALKAGAVDLETIGSDELRELESAGRCIISDSLDLLRATIVHRD